MSIAPHQNIRRKTLFFRFHGELRVRLTTLFFCRSVPTSPQPPQITMTRKLTVIRSGGLSSNCDRLSNREQTVMSRCAPNLTAEHRNFDRSNRLQRRRDGWQNLDFANFCDESCHFCYDRRSANVIFVDVTELNPISWASLLEFVWTAIVRYWFISSVHLQTIEITTFHRFSAGLLGDRWKSEVLDRFWTFTRSQVSHPQHLSELSC